MHLDGEVDLRLGPWTCAQSILEATRKTDYSFTLGARIVQYQWPLSASCLFHHCLTEQPSSLPGWSLALAEVVQVVTLSVYFKMHSCQTYEGGLAAEPGK
jgi:hypothetical protein